MPCLTLTERSKATAKLFGLVASYNIQPGNRVGLFWDTHTYILACLLTYLPRTQTGLGTPALRLPVQQPPITHVGHWSRRFPGAQWLALAPGANSNIMTDLFRSSIDQQRCRKESICGFFRCRYALTNTAPAQSVCSKIRGRGAGITRRLLIHTHYCWWDDG